MAVTNKNGHLRKPTKREYRYKKRKIKIMPQRNELVARAAVLGLDPTTISNDSKLEAKILYLEKNASANTGAIATTTLTSDTTTVAPNDTVTLNLRVYTFVTALTEVAASGTLSTTGSFSDGDLVVVDGITYIMRTTLNTGNQTQNEVLIGAAATNSLDNLKTTINGTGQGTTTNLATVIHPTCVAGTKTSASLVVSAKKVGTYGNEFVTATTGVNASWGAAYMASGANPVANQVLIGTNAAANLSNLKAAIDDAGTSGVNYSSNTSANKHVTTSTLTASTLLINSRNFALGNSIVTTTTATHLSFTGATMASGVPKVIAPVTTNDQISDAELHI